ncbi:MAG TPA: hypothetical protein VFM18_17835 [Methanosarcina sp.]|nr:hypothetical protein [Methanosarcina sp.]
MKNFSELKLRILFFTLTLRQIPIVTGAVLMLIMVPLNLILLTSLMFWAIEQLFHYHIDFTFMNVLASAVILYISNAFND